MSYKLPYKNFRWLDRDEIDLFETSKIDPEGVTCYILGADLHYPLTQYLPPAVETKMIEEHQLSPFDKTFLELHSEHFKASCNPVCSLKTR